MLNSGKIVSWSPNIFSKHRFFPNYCEGGIPKIYAVSFDNKNSLESTNDGEMTYCCCKGPDEGNMIGCENPDCLIEWFHWIV